MLTEFQTNFTNPAGAFFLTPLGNISGFSQAQKGSIVPKRGLYSIGEIRKCVAALEVIIAA